MITFFFCFYRIDHNMPKWSAFWYRNNWADWKRFHLYRSNCTDTETITLIQILWWWYRHCESDKDTWYRYINFLIQILSQNFESWISQRGTRVFVSTVLVWILINFLLWKSPILPWKSSSFVRDRRVNFWSGGGHFWKSVSVLYDADTVERPWIIAYTLVDQVPTW